ncbi:hypothetical protein SNEBB_009200 [Seison nebaliae]|nr:hypothetical protein SNEBB_009200 [Seison nebaliae]
MTNDIQFKHLFSLLILFHVIERCRLYMINFDMMSIFQAVNNSLITKLILATIATSICYFFVNSHKKFGKLKKQFNETAKRISKTRNFPIFPDNFYSIFLIFSINFIFILLFFSRILRNTPVESATTTQLPPSSINLKQFELPQSNGRHKSQFSFSNFVQLFSFALFAVLIEEIFYEISKIGYESGNFENKIFSKIALFYQTIFESTNMTLNVSNYPPEEDSSNEKFFFKINASHSNKSRAYIVTRLMSIFIILVLILIAFFALRYLFIKSSNNFVQHNKVVSEEIKKVVQSIDIDKFHKRTVQKPITDVEKPVENYWTDFKKFFSHNSTPNEESSEEVNETMVNEKKELENEKTFGLYYWAIPAFFFNSHETPERKIEEYRVEEAEDDGIFYNKFFNIFPSFTISKENIPNTISADDKLEESYFESLYDYMPRFSSSVEQEEKKMEQSFLTKYSNRLYDTYQHMWSTNLPEKVQKPTTFPSVREMYNNFIQNMQYRYQCAKMYFIGNYGKLVPNFIRDRLPSIDMYNKIPKKNFFNLLREKPKDIYNILPSIQFYNKLPSMDVYNKLPSMDIYNKLPSMDIYNKLPSIQFYNKLPSMDIYNKLPSMDIYNKLPSMQFYNKLPSMDIYNKLPSMQFYNKLPSMDIYNKLPSMQFYNKLPSMDIYNKLPSMDIYNKLPSMNIYNKLPSMDSVTRLSSIDVKLYVKQIKCKIATAIKQIQLWIKERLGTDQSIMESLKNVVEGVKRSGSQLTAKVNGYFIKGLNPVQSSKRINDKILEKKSAISSKCANNSMYYMKVYRQFIRSILSATSDLSTFFTRNPFAFNSTK